MADAAQKLPNPAPEHPRPAPPPRPPYADPWADQRARVGLVTLVRVINVDADSQEFLILAPQPDLRDLEFDGATVILPEAARTAAEAAEILARFDARYFSDPQQQQTRLSVLGRERYLRSRN